MSDVCGGPGGARGDGPGEADGRRPCRLHVVSGKGGTGKTTVAAALALALADEGRRTLLVEVEGRQGIAQQFETEVLPYEERRIAIGPGGGEVFALAIDAERALLEYLEMFYKLGGAGRALRRIGAIDVITTIAPGLRDVLLTGKVCEAVRRRAPGAAADDGWVYDAVVLDAPPTGRIARFLGVHKEVAHLARTGPIHHHAQAVLRVLKSPETAVHLVTLLEEMPVQETADGVAELRRTGLPVGSIVVNMVRPPVGAALPDGPADEAAAAAEAPGATEADGADGAADVAYEAALARSLARAGVRGAPALARPLLAQGREYAQRRTLERRQRRELDGLGQPIRELPLLAEGVDVAGLYRLARRLREWDW